MSKSNSKKKELMKDTTCSLCPGKPYRKLSIGSIEHEFCAFHSGFIMALEKVFKDNHAHWSTIK